MPYFLFEPDTPVTVHDRCPIPSAHSPMSYCYQPVSAYNKGMHWLVRNPKQLQWFPILDEGVPERYRLEVLLLLAAYPN